MLEREMVASDAEALSQAEGDAAADATRIGCVGSSGIPACTTDSPSPRRGPIYDKPSAERHWERLHALFAPNLG